MNVNSCHEIRRHGHIIILNPDDLSALGRVAHSCPDVVKPNSESVRRVKKSDKCVVSNSYVGRSLVSDNVCDLFRSHLTHQKL